MESDNPIIMSKDYTKTDRILLLIQTICKMPRLTLSEAKVKDILGNPSKAQYHKLINELMEDNGARKSILLKQKDENSNITFQLNDCDWVQYIEGKQEIHYILKSYKEMGHLFPKIDVDGVSVNTKNIDRRFHYLCKVKVKVVDSKLNNHLEMLIKALVGNRRVFIKYKDKDKENEKRAVEIYPLTLVQYRDDLYLVAYKAEMKEENIRHYKVSRILEIIESKEGFRYPTTSKWNPVEYFKNSSGIFVGNEKKARFKVYNESKLILSEKSFYNSQLISQTKDYDEYECIYTNIEEFVGFLFIYGQDVEIVSDSALKKMFREKAEKILKRNI
jgi:hypothetical protein